MDFEVIKFAAATLFGGGIVYGSVISEIKVMKQQLQDSKAYGERLAAIEAKLDLLITKKQ